MSEMTSTQDARTAPRAGGAGLYGARMRKRAINMMRSIVIPLLAIVIFLGLWSFGAKHVHTSLGVFPGPAAVWGQTEALYQEYEFERGRAAAFYKRLDRRVKKAEAEGKPPEYIAQLESHHYTGPPTFPDQIETSLITVMTGFLIGSLIAIPLGILIGMSQILYQAFSPIIQIFKPVSPLAWLPLVTMVVSAVYVTQNPMFAKSFLISAITVTLCSLWPTLISTAVGVSGVSKDLINVSRVLRLSWFTKTVKIVIPSSIPMIFTGLRVSLGIGWMVLIAAEMLAQNPGLGKFVWDQFQNGNSDSLSRIMVAVLVIGLIGFLLDWIMLRLQHLVNWDKNAVLR